MQTLLMDVEYSKDHRIASSAESRTICINAEDQQSELAVCPHLRHAEILRNDKKFSSIGLLLCQFKQQFSQLFISQGGLRSSHAGTKSKYAHDQCQAHQPSHAQQRPFQGAVVEKLRPRH